MKIRHVQQGGVLIISLIILLVMTLLGVSAMTDSGLQERMVANQKQVIQASMAAEAGAISAVRWLRNHPEAWGDADAWQEKKHGLAAKPPNIPNFGDSSVYWIETIHFENDAVTIVSRGGSLVDDKIIGQSVVTVVLQNQDSNPKSIENLVSLPIRGKVGGGLYDNNQDRLPLNSQQQKTIDNKNIKGSGSTAESVLEYSLVTKDIIKEITAVDGPEEAKKTTKVMIWRQTPLYGK